jgi:hypothetical protein
VRAHVSFLTKPCLASRPFFEGGGIRRGNLAKAFHIIEQLAPRSKLSLRLWHDGRT